MKNVLDIKKEKNLNFILPKGYLLPSKSSIDHSAVLIVVHLHYLDTVESYLEYIKNVPGSIRVIFTTSSDEVAKKIKQRFQRGNYTIVEKQNRGRDISSFLVACREEILKYEYFCFLHDKKEKTAEMKADTEKWVYSQWENMVGGASYVENVLSTFAENPLLGVLAPPLPILSKVSMAYVKLWRSDFLLTKELAKKLGLVCDLDPRKTPITIGTVFWARVAALRKLFAREWNYEDFDAEPLPIDGTVAHAIERIFAFVAQDAGYDTGWVMTDEYTGGYLTSMLDLLQSAFDWSGTRFKIRTPSDLECFDRQQEELTRFCERYQKIYIYGAGEYGQACLNRLRLEEKHVNGFLVTKLETSAYMKDVPVSLFSKEHVLPGTGIIIAGKAENQESILRVIHSVDPNFSDLYQFK